jgi:glycerol-3-phosphate cytidylyltransferase
MKRVITFGTFDLFHIGHLNIIQRSAALGDALIVGVSSDELNFEKKGFFPLYPLKDRIAIISALKSVASVFVEESLDLKREYILSNRADILVMGSDWTGKFDDMRNFCEVVYLPRTDDISSTAIKERLNFPI